MDNLFEPVPGELPEELISELLAVGGSRIERIVSRGHASPPGYWYDQDEAEWVIVLKGAARLEIETAGEKHMQPGDHIFLPAHCRHRVNWTDPNQDTVWLAVFMKPE